MPDYRSIDFTLYSQFGAEKIPELEPLPQEHYTSRGIVRAVPKLVDEASSTRSVYIPVLPGSVFWIDYAVSPPVPDGHYFLFKLYINSTHIVSWSTGKEEEWKGRTMFGLYERPEDEDGKRRVEKRVLSFTSPDKKGEWDDVKNPYEDNMRMDIKVHRAHGRVRMERKMEEYGKTEHGQDAKGIHLVNAGRASSDHPKRFYKFALIDPIDQPFATFRYYYRTWEQLEDMGLLEQAWRSEGEENDIPVIEPCVDGAREDGSSRASRKDADDVFYECANGTADGKSHTTQSSTDSQRKSPTKRASWRSPPKTKRPSSVDAWQSSPCASEQLHAYVPRGAPGAHREAQVITQQQRNSITRTPPESYRLSMPPSITLLPPDDASRPLPSLPTKSESQSSIAYRPHPAYPVEEWRTRTPSPVKSVREGLSTPPLEKRKEGRASSLLNAISSTWKRRGAERERQRDMEGRSGARSASG